MLAQCARIERVSKGREQGDAWLELERLLVCLSEGRARPVLLAQA
jgi:DNA polymerase-3 subunit delta